MTSSQQPTSRQICWGHHPPGKTVHTLAPVPHHFYNKVRQQLEEDIRRGIIQPVPSEPTAWCSCMVVVVHKKDGQAQKTVDYRRLKQVSIYETHHTRPSIDTITSVPKHPRFPWMKKAGSSQPSSHHGNASVICIRLWDTVLHRCFHQVL